MTTPTSQGQESRVLTRVELRRAVRDFQRNVWVESVGRALRLGSAWAVYRDVLGDWIFIHRATGLQAPGLYAKTLKGAAPVLSALEGCGADVTSLGEPGSAGPVAALARMRLAIRDALERADTRGLAPAWAHTYRPQTPTSEPTK